MTQETLPIPADAAALAAPPMFAEDAAETHDDAETVARLKAAGWTPNADGTWTNTRAFKYQNEATGKTTLVPAGVTRDAAEAKRLESLRPK